MATVIFSAVGTALAGPIGGALGAALGQQLDGALLGRGPAREGARIKELDVQTSSYGTQIPAIFGSVRAAGTVIWSTDLIERRTKSGGSKTRPATVNYSYSASFAVALSSRPVARIGRIWADGNLLRGASGDFKTETGFRFYSGFGDQPVDPLLASAERPGACPAYRGIAYAVFEDMQLADFGNRIPSLTFEVFERDSPVPVPDIVAVCSDSHIRGQSGLMLSGFAVQGEDCRAALQPLAEALPLAFLPSQNGMVLADWSAPSLQRPAPEPVHALGREVLERPASRRAAKNRAPAMVSIRHYDRERDFQAGVQFSRRTGSARNELRIELAAVMDAGFARELAELQLLQRRRNLNSFSATVPIETDAYNVGDWIAVPDYAAPLKIVEIEHQRGVDVITALEWLDHGLSGLSADAGRNLPGRDLEIGQSRLLLADLPALDTRDPESAILVAAVAGTGAGWRRAALSWIDEGTEVELGGTQGVSVIGNLVGALAPHTAMLVDTDNPPIVRLLHDAMTLPPGSGDPLSYDAPIIWIGGELVRYGHAARIGAREYRLNTLLRGCFGTDSAIPHPDSSAMFLLEPENLTRILDVPVPIGAAVTIEAMGLGDSIPVPESLLVAGHAIRPRPPVHGQVERLSNGGIALKWIRRDRLAYPWVDGVDAPNSEHRTDFAVDLLVDDSVQASWVVENTALTIDAAQWAGFAIPDGADVGFGITQQGRFARSLPLIVHFH